ncbi:MAG: aldose 1-epimerase family protein [Actinomycetota bacterium]|nr:aldose 1-epimerase family protein [Actinomycetota bacterium]
MTASPTSSTPSALTPTGTTVALELGAVRAEIGTVAAVLRSLTVDGHDLVQPTRADEPPAMCNGAVLSPWPNRVRAGRWLLDDAPQQLDITEPARGGALHGLLQFTDYTINEQTDAAATLSATVFPQHGWPFLLDTWIRYELTADGLTATHGVTNRAAARAPYAIGTHPYLRVGDAAIAELELTVSAATYFEVDALLDPIDEVPVEGTAYDVRIPQRVGGIDFDTAFGQVEHANASDGPTGARGDVAWLTAPDGSRTTLWQNLDWGYVQVFTTRIFPTSGGLIDAIAVEPMTAPPDALNSGQSLIWLEPGERWSGSWGLRYAGGDEGE